ncbi:MAG TPA: hypothetical protein VNO32_62665, partial [Candidatus Acidoferrum sp.]|nr:hypothetical protein [Candidatus Acidoferrum sp.]
VKRRGLNNPQSGVRDILGIGVVVEVWGSAVVVKGLASAVKRLAVALVDCCGGDAHSGFRP